MPMKIFATLMQNAKPKIGLGVTLVTSQGKDFRRLGKLVPGWRGIPFQSCNDLSLSSPSAALSLVIIFTVNAYYS
jgi:hypothetical protein